MTSLLPAKRSSSSLLVFLLILISLANQGCVPIYTGVPVIDAANIAAGAVCLTIDTISNALDNDPDDADAEKNITEFYETGLGIFLRAGEEVLFYSRNAWREKITVTNERVFITHVYRDSDNIFKSIEHVDIRKIDWLMWSEKSPKEIHIYTYDSASPVVFTYYADKEKITQVIQTQVDYVNTIRCELGITIPETVTTSELIKLNEPVIAELRARRQIK